MASFDLCKVVADSVESRARGSEYLFLNLKETI